MSLKSVMRILVIAITMTSRISALINKPMKLMTIAMLLRTKYRLRINLVLAVLFVISNINAQSVTNGEFTSASSGWSCSPETNPESIYGGNGSNTVAEVDAAAGLCQTISGFTVGSLYKITFDCSRRTSCGPATQTLDFGIDGGALATQTVSRTGAFNLTAEFFSFTATATSHTIDFNGTSAGTCGLIIDNIVISLVSVLPVELLSFNASPMNNEIVQLKWQTASETNNDYFTLERSQNGTAWEEVSSLDGAGNSSALLSYSATDSYPYTGISYYRLKQTDFNGQFEYSQIRSVRIDQSDNSTIEIYPNPTKNNIIVSGNISELEQIKVYNSLGQDVSAFVSITGNNELEATVVDLSKLIAGIYYLKTKTTSNMIYKQ